MKIVDVMTRGVVSVSPETTLKEVAALLVERRISGVPVADADGRVVGVVSEADVLEKERGLPERARGLLALFAAGMPAEERTKELARTAAEAMTSPAVTIRPERSVREAAAIMLDRGVNRLPVVNASGALVGIVTRADLVRAFVRTDAELTAEIRDQVLLHELWLDPDSFELDVADGEVTIAGRLERRDERELLERRVALVPGVVSVSVRDAAAV